MQTEFFLKIEMLIVLYRAYNLYMCNILGYTALYMYVLLCVALLCYNLSLYYLVCADNHVRSWSVARFRGCISTQPGSTSGSSFKVLSLDGTSACFYPSVSIGNYSVCCIRVCVSLLCTYIHTHTTHTTYTQHTHTTHTQHTHTQHTHNTHTHNTHNTHTQS